MKGRALSALGPAFARARSDAEGAVAHVIFGMTLAAAMLAVCIVIRPQSLRVNYGVSYLGISLSTIVPYAVALLGAALCVWRASDLLAELDHGPVISRLMKVMALQLVGLLLTPYTRFDAAHIFFGSTLFLMELGLAFLAIRWLGDGDRRIPVLTGIMVASGIAAAYFLPQKQGFELQAQLVFQLAFWMLVIRLLRGLQLEPAGSA